MWNDYDHSDQEIDVYEQCCDNCTNRHCPMMMPETAEEHYAEYGTMEDFDEEEAEEISERVMQRRKEDAVMRGDDLAWCIHWKGRRGGRR
jgi:hypothetical protein